LKYIDMLKSAIPLLEATEGLSTDHRWTIEELRAQVEREEK